MKFKTLLFIANFFLFQKEVLAQPTNECNIIPDIFRAISYDNTLMYLRNYNDVHNASINEHTQVAYVSSNTIKFLGEFFRNNSGFEGLNIYLINYPQTMNLDRQNPNQVMYAFVPINSVNQLDFNALENYYNSLQPNPYNKYEINRSYICPGICDKVLNGWLGGTAPVGNLPTTPPPDRDNGERLLFMSETEVMDYHAKYYLNQGQEFNTLQTKRIYFDKKTFEFLFNFIDKPGHIFTYPLFGLYSINYGFVAPRNNIFKDQTTITFIPMKKENNELIPYICDLLRYMQSLPAELISTSERIKSLNHGEICPQVCHPQ